MSKRTPHPNPQMEQHKKWNNPDSESGPAERAAARWAGSPSEGAREKTAPGRPLGFLIQRQ